MIIITEVSGLYDYEYRDKSYINCNLSTDYFDFEFYLN